VRETCSRTKTVIARFAEEGGLVRRFKTAEGKTEVTSGSSILFWSVASRQSKSLTYVRQTGPSGNGTGNSAVFCGVRAPCQKCLQFSFPCFSSGAAGLREVADAALHTSSRRRHNTVKKRRTWVLTKISDSARSTKPYVTSAIINKGFFHKQTLATIENRPHITFGCAPAPPFHPCLPKISWATTSRRTNNSNIQCHLQHPLPTWQRSQQCLPP